MTQLFDLNARIQQLTWSLIFNEKYSTSLSYLWFSPPLILGGLSNFWRYYTRSQTGKSTRYRPTLKPLHDDISITINFKHIVHFYDNLVLCLGSVLIVQRYSTPSSLSIWLTSLTCSSLLICRGMEDLKKPLLPVMCQWLYVMNI